MDGDERLEGDLDLVLCRLLRLFSSRTMMSSLPLSSTRPRISQSWETYLPSKEGWTFAGMLMVLIQTLLLKRH